jgi:small subunit ribosomal protein S19e
MTTANDVPANLLIERLASKLSSVEAIKQPDWAKFAKTGSHREKGPARNDWWIIRVAAVLRKVYLNGPIGVERLSAEYGGRCDHGSAPYHAVRGSRAVARAVVKQLEAGKLIKIERGRGRSVTSTGQALIDNTSHEVLKELAVNNPELTKYL